MLSRCAASRRNGAIPRCISARSGLSSKLAGAAASGWERGGKMRIRAAECVGVRARRETRVGFLFTPGEDLCQRHDDSGATSILTLRSVYCVNNSDPSEFRVGGEAGRGRAVRYYARRAYGLVRDRRRRAQREDCARGCDASGTHARVRRSDGFKRGSVAAGGSHPRGSGEREAGISGGGGGERRRGIRTMISWFRRNSSSFTLADRSRLPVPTRHAGRSCRCCVNKRGFDACVDRQT